MITFKYISDLMKAQDRFSPIINDIKYCLGIEGDFQAAIAENDSLSWWLGGDIHVIERKEELSQINSYDLDNEDATVMSTVTSWDACNLIEGDDGKYAYVLFYMVTNNSGGDVFYVPIEFAKEARAIEHYLASNEVQGNDGKMSIGAAAYEALRKFLRESASTSL